MKTTLKIFFSLLAAAALCWSCQQIDPIQPEPASDSLTLVVYGGEMETNTYVCTSCGAALDTDPTTAVTNCPYCGNAVEIAGQMSKAVKPDYCIPFRYEKKDAIKALKEYYSGKKLLPRSFTDGSICRSGLRSGRLPRRGNRGSGSQLPRLSGCHRERKES